MRGHKAQEKLGDRLAKEDPFEVALFEAYRVTAE
jgi:hypothetical protein